MLDPCDRKKDGYSKVANEGWVYKNELIDKIFPEYFYCQLMDIWVGVLRFTLPSLVIFLTLCNFVAYITSSGLRFGLFKNKIILYVQKVVTHFI